MSRPNLITSQSGFTITELTVVIVLIGLLTTSLFAFFNTTSTQYFALHEDSVQFGDLANQTQRVAKVVRGLTDITQATADELTFYAYFYPNDTYVSLVHYYKSPDGKILYADVTPMTANPPNGALITSSKKTYTVLNPLKNVAGLNIFTYQDASGNTLPMPVADLHTIKGVSITLAVPSKNPGPNGASTMSLSVSLRNRKTNL